MEFTRFCELNQAYTLLITSVVGGAAWYVTKVMGFGYLAYKDDFLLFTF